MSDPAPEERAALDALLDALMHYGGTFNRKQGFQDGWAAGRAYEREQIDRAEERQDETP